MRTVMLCVALACAGCAGGDAAKPAGGEAADARPARPPLTFTEHDNTYIDDYRKNVVAGDLKWKGKRGVQRVRVDDLGRDDSGVLWLAQASVLHRHPGIYFRLVPGQEARFSRLAKGNDVYVECTCDGREDDRIYRGIDGYGFRVNFSDCVFLNAPPG